MDPIQIHLRSGAKQCLRPSLQRLALLTACGVFLAAATFNQAQEQPQPAELQPLPQSVQPPQAPVESTPASVLATVHGVVRNAATGEPLPRALVRIEGDADTGTLTDNQGRFELPGVPAGPQTIRVRKPGFQDRPYATEDVGYQGDGPAHNVLVAAEMPDLDFALSPTSAIHGHVELSTGDPAQGIGLTLLKQVIRNGRAVWAQNGTTKTNGEGAYRFAGLPAGVYALYTQPTLESEPAMTGEAPGAKVVRSGYPSVFYPEAREFSGATRIRLKAGEQAEANLQLTLEPFYAVTAAAILPDGKKYGSEGTQSYYAAGSGLASVLDAAGGLLPYTVQFDSGTNSLRADLPDGTYSFFVGIASSEKGSSGLGRSDGRNRNPATLLTGVAEFSIEQHVVANLRIPLARASGWPIHLRTVRAAEQASTNASQRIDAMVTVTATDARDALMSNRRGEVTAEKTGSDLLELELNADPGPRWISTLVDDRSLCVDSFTAGGINLAREPLNVAPGASPPPMELTLRDDCAKLALTLPPALSAFLPGDEPFYTVYVVPDFDTTADIPPMNMHPSSGATLAVDGLTPGGYHVYVFDRPVRLEYRNPEAIAALPTPGQAVTLTAGTTSNLVLEVPER